jgi:hypothetical protein
MSETNNSSTMSVMDDVNTTVHQNLSLYTLSEVVELLLKLGVTSLYGVLLVKESNVDMDGCYDHNLSFKETGVDQVDNFFEYQDLEASTKYDPFLDPDYAVTRASYKYTQFSTRKMFYDSLSLIIDNYVWTTVVIPSENSTCPDELKHLLEFEGWETDLPIDE